MPLHWLADRQLAQPCHPACGDRCSGHYTARMVRLACAAAVFLIAELAMGCGITPQPPRQPPQSEPGCAAMSESADRQPFEPLLRAAIGDLAQRLNIDPADIGVIETRSIMWPDRSLGCPRPGMAYAQVPQDGALIRLQAQGREFAYHSGGGRAPFLCDKQR
jgi:hypothetical protein